MKAYTIIRKTYVDCLMKDSGYLSTFQLWDGVVLKRFNFVHAFVEYKVTLNEYWINIVK